MFTCSSGVEPARDIDGASPNLDREFRHTWLRRLQRVLPLPTVALGAWWIWEVRTLWAVVAFAVYVAFNMGFSQAVFRWPRLADGGYLRALGNLLTLGLVGLVSTPSSPAWLLVIPTTFGGMFSLTRRQAWLTVMGGAVGALVGWAAIGAHPQDVVEAAIVLASMAFVAEVLYRPIREGFVAEQRQREALEAANRELREARAARATFLANMSHEVRTPINGLVGVAEVLKQSGLDEGQRQLLALAEVSTARLLQMLNDLLEIASAVKGQESAPRKPFQPEQVVHAVVEQARVQAQLRGLALELRADALPESLLGDAARLRHVLNNLVGNAIKFTPQGLVEVRASWQPSRLTLSVRDTGVGIAPEAIEEVFEPFVQADGSITRAHEGAGLGLAVCRRLVDEMGGELHVESTPGEGSVFTVDVEAEAA